jgi:hypothetical protein
VHTLGRHANGDRFANVWEAIVHYRRHHTGRAAFHVEMNMAGSTESLHQ